MHTHVSQASLAVYNEMSGAHAGAAEVPLGCGQCPGPGFRVLPLDSGHPAAQDTRSCGA